MVLQAVITLLYLRRLDEIYTDRQLVPLDTKYNAAAEPNERDDQTQEKPKLYELQHTQAFITIVIHSRRAKIISWEGSAN